MAENRDLLLAYAAGVIDSDGTIGIHKKLAVNATDGSRQDCYEPRVCVKQVTPEAIDVLSQLFGGYRSTAKAYCKNGRPLFEWRGTGRVCCKALDELIPHLRIKRAQAENAVEVGKLNAAPKSRPVLLVDESEGWISLREAAVILGKPIQSLRVAVSSGRLPSVGCRSTRRVPLATARLYAQGKPGGPSRSAVQTEELQIKYSLSKQLNRVGLASG